MSGRARLKHQTDSLQRTRRMSLFVASSSLPNPNSISIPVFMLNVFSLTVTNYILIHEMHFTEETVWLVRVWHELPQWKNKSERWWKQLFVFVFPLSCWWKLAAIQESQWWLWAVKFCRLDSVQPFFLSLFNISSLTSWKTNLWISICCRSLSTSRQLCFHA